MRDPVDVIADALEIDLAFLGELARQRVTRRVLAALRAEYGESNGYTRPRPGLTIVLPIIPVPSERSDG